MVKHVILWKLKEELTAEEKENVKAGIKAGGKYHLLHPPRSIYYGSRRQWR